MHHSEEWRQHLERGKRYLAKHHPETALSCLEKAVAACPVNQHRDLSRALYLLGVTLKKLGMSNCALKSWVAAHRLYREGYSGRLLQRMVNEYGMAKQGNRDLDNWKAFYSIQLIRYLETKRSKRLGTEAERDMIWDLVHEAWKEAKATHDFNAMSPEQRLNIFRGTKIVFPSFTVRDAPIVSDAVPVDFAKKRRILLDDPCFCGSGLPFKSCCGRTPGEDEIVNGI